MVKSIKALKTMNVNITFTDGSKGSMELNAGYIYELVQAELYDDGYYNLLLSKGRIIKDLHQDVVRFLGDSDECVVYKKRTTTESEVESEVESGSEEVESENIEVESESTEVENGDTVAENNDTEVKNDDTE